jgi:hypothetical protein
MPRAGAEIFFCPLADDIQYRIESEDKRDDLLILLLQYEAGPEGCVFAFFGISERKRAHLELAGCSDLWRQK